MANKKKKDGKHCLQLRLAQRGGGVGVGWGGGGGNEHRKYWYPKEYGGHGLKQGGGGPCVQGRQSNYFGECPTQPSQKVLSERIHWGY